jgi:hypothetical protein
MGRDGVKVETSGEISGLTDQALAARSLLPLHAKSGQLHAAVSNSGRLRVITIVCS